MRIVDSKIDLTSGDWNKSLTAQQKLIGSDPNGVHEVYERRLREESLKCHFVEASKIPVV